MHPAAQRHRVPGLLGPRSGCRQRQELRADRPFPIIDATPFTWTVDSGTLPPGLSLSSGGAITGTPTAAGTFNFTLKVVDSTGLTATQAQTITIAPGCAPPPTTPTTPTPTPPTPTPPTPAPPQSTVQVVKTWVGTPSTTTIFVDANGQAPYDASVVADTNGATTSFTYPVSTSVTVGETPVPTGFTATIDCGQGAQTYSAPITVNAPATAGATLVCRIVNTANPAPPPPPRPNPAPPLPRPVLVIEKVANKHAVRGWQDDPVHDHGSRTGSGNGDERPGVRRGSGRARVRARAGRALPERPGVLAHRTALPTPKHDLPGHRARHASAPADDRDERGDPPPVLVQVDRLGRGGISLQRSRACRDTAADFACQRRRRYGVAPRRLRRSRS